MHKKCFRGAFIIRKRSISLFIVLQRFVLSTCCTGNLACFVQHFGGIRGFRQKQGAKFTGLNVIVRDPGIQLPGLRIDDADGHAVYAFWQRWNVSRQVRFSFRYFIRLRKGFRKQLINGKCRGRAAQFFLIH